MRITIPPYLKNCVVSVVLLNSNGSVSVLVAYYSKLCPEKNRKEQQPENYMSWLHLRYGGLPIILYTDFNMDMRDKRRK